MSNFSDQLDEIKTLLSSNINKAFAYSTLLHLQEQSSNTQASIQILAESCQSLIPLIVADVHEDDEEIATQALKCLGFMIYHPSLVAPISVDEANLVLDSLVKLITTTKMKAVCNLGVWCISIQQFNYQLLASHFHPLLQAVVHALDNPIGSLSTTFEATQAVMKLAVQLDEKMRDMSHVWVPPIYRRLLSFDKKERDMSERCLLKIKSLILPPPLKLSKALVRDMKQKLLTGMKDMLSHDMKVKAIIAWGWFIRLLGSHALKNRHLVNDMLKIPEHTFSDQNAQVQNASQVAWEGLIDALIFPPTLPCKRNAMEEEEVGEQMGTSKSKNNEIQSNGFSKSIKLIMTPLIGIISSNCDASVRSSCFNTWCYLLHKLDSSVNCPSVRKLVLQPIFEAVFQIGLDSNSIWLWNQCVNLLDDSILAKCTDVDQESSHLVSQSTRSSMHGCFISEKCSWKLYPIKWLPWDLSQLDFYLKIIYILIHQASKTTFLHENRKSSYDASLRLFRSVSKGVQLELKKLSTNYDDVTLCLKTILKFIINFYEENFEGSDRNDLHHISLQFVEVVTDEINAAILGSPLYKVPLDLKCIERQLVNAIEHEHAKDLVMCSITYMDMVSPMVYLTAFYFCVVVQSTLNMPKIDFFLQAIKKYFKIMLSSYDPVENFIVTIGLLYMHTGPSCLRMWIAVVKVLKDTVFDKKDISLYKMENGRSFFATCHLLSYPFFIFYCHQKALISANVGDYAEESFISVEKKLDLRQILEVWKSLYSSLCTPQFECFSSNSFCKELCNMLSGWLEKYTILVECANDLNPKDLDLDLISLCGGVVIYILEQSQSSVVSSEYNRERSRDDMIPSGMTSCMTLVIRFMKLLQTGMGKGLPTDLAVLSRVCSLFSSIISCLHLKLDILSVIEMMSCPLLQWLTHKDMRDENTSHQLQLVWTEILNCLRRSQPPIIFDSALLRHHAPLLEKTLDHPNPTISEPTINFWNSTYGEQINLDYPQTLLHVLDKLSRSGRINLHKRSQVQRCDSPQKYTVSAAHNNRSKRIELVKDCMNHVKHKEMPYSSLKRRRLELTEHQKEVRRAQQGRGMDCGGHGPGIRTYTNVDFSQGNEDSQESQEFRDSESMLEMLKRAF
ncbi:uncharacterized protein LOC107428164 isoform X1 [Ziziphus jujuba]|uniref:Uncharacterized protein LOC107428164 isoform X1 n=2 Tax=Ziziphus jujuba TaxID=326968 RepID=A0A6P4AXX6_ZIZJJ|nr:uncharacterized protein LOC107428164 isoform X1 [Ziziphus jujuba]